MKSRTLLFAAFLAAPFSSLYAQGGGNVGIGTTAPSSKLTVNGNTAVGSGYTGTAAPANGAIIEGKVGIGTTTPAAGAKLHVAGPVQIVDGTQGSNKIFMSDAQGLGSWKNLSETKEVMVLANVIAQNVLAGMGPIGQSPLTNFTQAVNSIVGAGFNTNTDVVMLPEGNYEISFSLELQATGPCPTQGFLINSYMVGFPDNGSTVYIHANSPSMCDPASPHSALWVTTVNIPAGGQTWPLKIFRGAGGNYYDVANVDIDSRIVIKKLL